MDNGVGLPTSEPKPKKSKHRKGKKSKSKSKSKTPFNSLTPEPISPTPEDDLPLLKLAEADKFTPEKVTPEKVTPEKVTSEKVTPEKVTPEKVTPEKLTPEKVTPVKLTPEKIITKKAMVMLERVTPEKNTPETVTAEKVTPVKITLKKVTLKKFTPEKVASEKLMPKKVTPEKNTPEKIASEKLMPKKVTTEKNTPEKILLDEVMPEKVTPETVTSERVPPKKFTRRNVMPKKVIRKKVTSEKVKPKKVTPRKVKQKKMPENVIPKEVTPEELRPEKVLRDEIMPEKVMPYEITPKETIPDEITPKKTIPDEFMPEKTIPVEITPKTTMPDEFMPEKTTADEFMPEKITPDKIMPEKVSLDEVMPEKNTPENNTPEKVTLENFTLEKVNETADVTEYCPDKAKRPCSKKKAVLKHQFNLKDIRNKRKCTVPRKGVQVEEKDPQRVELSELSVFEIIRYVDECGCMDEECIVEIVNCPSPVWWEDPPDEQFCEDPIDPELVKEALEGMCESPPPIEEDVTARVQMLIREKKANDKFLKQKVKLESILGNLRNRVLKMKTVKPNEGVDEKNAENVDENDKAEGRFSESSEGEILSDISANEEEVLKNLETIMIPVKNPSSDIARKDRVVHKPTVPKTRLLQFPYQSAAAEFKRFKHSTNTIKSDRDSIQTDPFDEESTSDGVAVSTTRGTTKRKSKSTLCSDVISDVDSISDSEVRFLDDDDVEMLSCTFGNDQVGQAVRNTAIVENGVQRDQNIKSGTNEQCMRVNVNGAQDNGDECVTVVQYIGDVSVNDDQERDIDMTGEKDLDGYENGSVINIDEEENGDVVMKVEEQDEQWFTKATENGDGCVKWDQNPDVNRTGDLENGTIDGIDQENEVTIVIVDNENEDTIIIDDLDNGNSKIINDLKNGNSNINDDQEIEETDAINDQKNGNSNMIHALQNGDANIHDQEIGDTDTSRDLQNGDISMTDDPDCPVTIPDQSPTVINKKSILPQVPTISDEIIDLDSTDNCDVNQFGDGVESMDTQTEQADEELVTVYNIVSSRPDSPITDEMESVKLVLEKSQRHVYINRWKNSSPSFNGPPDSEVGIDKENKRVIKDLTIEMDLLEESSETESKLDNVKLKN